MSTCKKTVKCYPGGSKQEKITWGKGRTEWDWSPYFCQVISASCTAL